MSCVPFAFPFFWDRFDLQIMTSSSDGTSPSLIAAAKNQDSAAWSRLVNVYSPLVFSWCHKFGCDLHTSQDISQETFLSASRAISGLRADGTVGTFRRWLWTITRNKLIDHYRRSNPACDAAGGSSAQRNLAMISVDSKISEADPSSPDMIQSVVMRAMEYVRTEFRESSWQAFWLTSIDGMPTDLVAEKLGITAAAVRQSRSRIMRRMREELGDYQP